MFRPTFQVTGLHQGVPVTREYSIGTIRFPTHSSIDQPRSNLGALIHWSDFNPVDYLLILPIIARRPQGYCNPCNDYDGDNDDRDYR